MHLNLTEKEKKIYLFKVITPAYKYSANAKILKYEDCVDYIKAIMDEIRRDAQKAKAKTSSIKDYRISFEYDLEQLVELYKKYAKETKDHRIYSIYTYKREEDLLNE